MLHQIFAITYKDWQVLVRDRGGMVSLFLMPIMFILVMSAAQQGMYTFADEDNPLEILIVNPGHWLVGSRCNYRSGKNRRHSSHQQLG